jgi:hypothetical protein
VGYYEIDDIMTFHHQTLKEQGSIIKVTTMGQIAQIVESNNGKL